MAGDQNARCRRLWISYPWIGNEERDFAYLVSQLRDTNIEAVYDSFELLPDTRLWQRIVQRLHGIGFDGWLYILTHRCLTSRKHADELTSAIDQTLLKMGPGFPIAGLIYDMATQNVPPVLRMFPCISLGDPNWKRLLSGVLENGASPNNKQISGKETRFAWKVHASYDTDSNMRAIEVRPRCERIQYWRFAVPKSIRIVRWGQGQAGGGEISRVRFAESKGSGRYECNDVIWFGAANTISNTESAYVVFSGPLPDFVCFGPAQSPYGPPGPMEIFWPNLNQGR